MGERKQTIGVKSTPNEASVTITDEKDREVFKGQTPVTVTLNKSDGSYFGGKSYIVKIAKQGYETQTIPIESSPNGWYIFGNLAFGVIGWLIVDPQNGGMYTLSPSKIRESLVGKTARNNQIGDENISIVLLEDVPRSFQDGMVKIH